MELANHSVQLTIRPELDVTTVMVDRVRRRADNVKQVKSSSASIARGGVAEDASMRIEPAVAIRVIDVTYWLVANAGSRAMPRSPASPTWNRSGTVAKGAASSVPLDSMIRMLPVSFSVKKILPSGAKESETGKLTPARKVETGDDACARKNIAGPSESVITKTIRTYNFRERLERSEQSNHLSLSRPRRRVEAQCVIYNQSTDSSRGST